MNLKCRFLGHRWSNWEEVGNHLERECLRPGCGTILAKYPPWASVLAEGLVEIAEAYAMFRWDLPPKRDTRVRVN